ncbi:HAMP domain-containing protein [Paraconexibacter antarcticus]|uniref:histidine kinase n=1 Tax=Paraconexibacter antarcticus TaxID=2949664 RepID=A0ABY5DNZ2_9ACTN|nr:HAMP domain-containing protein [Paraconexibacter antarcticus]UTI62334.1 HAMP domain-containing protein [Paraconexibacter antarcticus]
MKNSAGGTPTTTRTPRASSRAGDEEVLVRLRSALRAAADGDFSTRLPARRKGIVGEIEGAYNDLVERNAQLTAELVRLGRVVGREGRMTERANVGPAGAGWETALSSVNGLVDDLVRPTTEVARVIVAVAEGDLTQKMELTIDGQPVKGEFARIGTTVNTMVDQLGSFADEVSRVAREVGTEGKLGGQAEVPGVAGTWKDLTENVNFMASNLTDQVREIATVTTAVAGGDLSKKITVDARGEVLELKSTINTMVDQLGSFADEVTRVAREVGTEGKLGGQAEVPGVAGTWKDLTDNVNFMASNLTDQVRGIAQVATAVAKGDLGQKITVEATGEVGALADTINSMTDTLSVFAEQVTGVAREVGTDGKLGGQAEVPGVAGTWKDLTDSVNSMAANLTDQVRNIAQVTTAVAEGDLSQKITVDAKGEVLQLKDTINTMVEQLRAFADEVTRVAREVGTEGRLGGQAFVPGVAGTWKDLTDNVNSMATNLTDQVRNIAQVTTAVAKGDLSQKITVDAKGEVLQLKDTINTMVEQLSAFADEVTRVAREVGTEGALGGQAEVAGVSGTWRDLTENVNFMARNLTDQVRNIAAVTTAVAGGDLSKKITVDARGEILELKDTINTMVEQLRAFAAEVTRVAREVGTEGKLGGQAEVAGVSGTWKGLTENVNLMATNLTDQVRGIATVTTAVANGDLSKKITVEAKGEVAALADTINTMVDQLSSFADEVTRVAREVGTEGKLGGQAKVENVSGTWRDLTNNVNSMATNLTSQVRNIAHVATAVAGGDLSQKITVEAEGEILELKQTLNTMVDQLSSFADEVTRVAREVGTEGKLGGQARVEGVAGTWRDLTENVNQLAGNLTTQVRAIGEVSTAVTQGDLTRTIAVEAQGEVAGLKDNINQMIENLRETTKVNAEQDWLKTNLARISGMLQGQRDLEAVTQLIMSEVTPVVSAQHGAFFLATPGAEADAVTLDLIASYGYVPGRGAAMRFRLGEGLVGQVAQEARAVSITDVPDGYVTVRSALGHAAPAQIVVMPITFEEQVLGVIELASLRPFTEVNRAFLDQLTETIGVVLNTLQANMRTEELLAQSQALTQELQKQSEELRQTNDELQDKTLVLQQQNRDIEIKNAEIELARAGLEEKAAQLALSSKYKSEFLANMSHELRTPLNSLLILSRMLSDNEENNLTDSQVEFARTIHGAGNDLLALINDILDLSKVEAGKMDLNAGPVAVSDLCDDLERSFRPVAEQNRLAFAIDRAAGLPFALVTDEQRLQQVLRNLLSNAFKFTERGSVRLRIEPAERGTVEFTVQDTGVGIAEEKLGLIFEAFQQADGTTSRRYGGTGLGLSISREIAHLLGGELRVVSRLGEGSAFTLVLPTSPRLAEVPAGLPPAPGAAAPPASPAGDRHDPGMREHVTPTAHGNGNGATAPARGPVHDHAEPDEAPVPAFAGLEDDRGTLEVGDRVLLVIAHDAERAREALAVARERGFKVLVARRAPMGLALAREHRPDAVLIFSGDGRGEVLLAQLKQDPETRHRPVFVVGPDGGRLAALRAGAAGAYADLPTGQAVERVDLALAERATRDVRRLALVGSGGDLDPATMTLLGAGDDIALTALDPADALGTLAAGGADCVVVPAQGAVDGAVALLEEAQRDDRLRELPFIVFAPEAVDREDRVRLEALCGQVNAKVVTSPERLVDETALHLHRMEARLPAPTRKLLAQLRAADSIFHGKRILIVDDDVRNVFALTSALELRGMKVLYAENGREGLKRLAAQPDIDLVLLDVMMPEMDGYETARAIRTQRRFETLPIISLTAKAMKGDRDKCIDAGASDYITKPVDMDQLLSLMRVWLQA